MGLEGQCKNKSLILQRDFIPILVSSKVSLFEKYYYEKGPVKLYFGIKEKYGFVNFDEIHPDETVIAFSQINPYTENKILTY